MIERVEARREGVANESSEIAAASRAKAVFIAAWLALLVLKAWLAASVALFGDEAFYWQESRALAAGYSDVPPLTAWLIRLGTSLGGLSEAGVRWSFVALGSSVPWLVVAWARGITGRRDAWLAGALATCLPLSALLGVFALPDVPMTCAILAAAIALGHAMRSDRTGAWLVFGAMLALGWLSHYRYAMFYLAGAVLLVATPAGRALLRHRGFWLAQALGLLGLVPALAFNLAHSYAALSFQFVERHAWAFDARALADPAVQALVTTPVLFAACVIAIVRAARARADVRPVLLWTLAGGLLGGYLVVGLFADVERSRFHWPLPAYLLALPLVPAVLRSWSGSRAGRVLARFGVALGAAATLAFAALLAHGTRPDAAPTSVDWLTDNTRGWHEVGAWFRAGAYRTHSPPLVVADNFMLGAELDFALGGRTPVFVLDHPANRKHGRAAQLSIWRRDEAALAQRPWQRAVLVVEEASRRPVERLAAYRALCRRFGAVRALDELRLRGGRAVFTAFEVVPGRDAAPCHVPAFGYIDEPPPGATLRDAAVVVRGWAIEEGSGIARVVLRVDGQRRGVARYGLPRPGVAAQWPESRDPNHPDVGFEGGLDLRGLVPGEHELALELTGRDGRVRIVAEQRFIVP